jgi:nitroreductase
MNTLTPADPALLAGLLHRQSASSLVEPAPSAAELEQVLQAAATVPDHGRLRPYRFIVVSGAGREHFGNALAAAGVEAQPDLPVDKQEKLKKKAFAAPAQIVLIASLKDSPKIPEWEQMVAASCTGFAIVLAAHALGLGAVWKSTAFPDGRELKALFGLSPSERTLGWVNIGHRSKPEDKERRPADLTDFVGLLSGDAVTPYTPAG